MIKLRITTAGGTKIELDIPIDDSKPASIESAVPYQPEPVTPVETATETQDEVVRLFDEPTPVQPATDLEDAMWKYKTSPTFPSNKDLEPIENERREGEKGEDGRIGGVGERKDKGEGEGGEENRVLVFKCVDGDYTLPPALHSDFCAAFGTTFTERELTLARLWVETNPAKRKTRRGMGRFLNAWMCRAQGEKRTPLSQRTGSLLEASNPSQEGW